MRTNRTSVNVNDLKVMLQLESLLDLAMIHLQQCVNRGASLLTLPNVPLIMGYISDNQNQISLKSRLAKKLQQVLGQSPCIIFTSTMPATITLRQE